MSKRTKLVIVAVVVIAGLALWFTPPPELTLPAPPVPRLAEPQEREVREISTLALLDWGRHPTPVFMVDVPRDALPNGLALSMLPFLVDWEHTRVEGPDANVRVRNVSVGGNPTAGENLLATVDVPLGAITDVQWCLTPDRNKKGKDTAMGHAMLRFLFAADKQPLALDNDGAPLPLVAPLDDLILSWEAWRPPQTRYDPIAGMDPSTYALTARAYSGQTRWLGDALRGNPWDCYPLKLPETDDADIAILMTGLLVGDAMARRTLDAMFKAGELPIPDAAALTAFTQADTARIKATFSTEALPADPLSHLMGKADLSYQLLERSCITQSLGVIQLALIRLYEEHGLGPAPNMRIIPQDLPDWVRNLSTAGTGQMLSYLPGAVLYVMKNHQIIPGNAYQILADADLLHQQDDGPLYYKYFYKDQTPYGGLRDNMM
jgi:hypothetical protein